MDWIEHFHEQTFQEQDHKSQMTFEDISIRRIWI